MHASFHAELDQALKAVAPVVGVSFIDEDDKTSWRLQFDESATEAQRKAAHQVIAGFSIEQARAKAACKERLYETDYDMMRGIDDVIDLLITKGIVRDTDLPPKLMQRVQDRALLRAGL